MGFWNTVWTDDWWTTYALDAIGGGVVGGAVTGGAVWWTIRHERQMRMADRGDLELDALRVMVHDLRERAARALAWANWMPFDDLAPGELSDKTIDLFSALVGVEAASEGLAPRLSGNLEVLSSALTQISLEEPMRDIAAIGAASLTQATAWIFDPAEYEGIEGGLTIEEVMGSLDGEDSDPGSPGPAGAN